METKEQVLRATRRRQQPKNLRRLQALVSGLEARAAAETLTLKDADSSLKDVKLAIGTMGPLPTKQDRDDLTVRLQAVRTSLAPRIQEMREGEEWKRWANVQVQEELCDKMEALVAIAEAEPEKAATEMQELQERWKSVAAAPRSQAEVLWTRFKAAQDQVYDKCKDFFAQQAAERAENLKKKTELCERPRRCSTRTDWVKTADAMKALQAEWKTIGPVTRGSERRDLGALPRRLRRVLHPAPGRPEAAQARLDREPPPQGSARSPRPSSSRSRPSWEKAAARIKQLQAGAGRTSAR